MSERIFGECGVGECIMTEFIMLVGIPASGKSTYAHELEKQGYHIHSSDAIRKELTGDSNSQNINNKVFEILHKRIKSDLGNGVSCVYDATNMSMKRRISFLNEIKKYECHKKCALFVTPVEVCKERNQNRERKVPDSVFGKMLKQFQCPYYYEGWDDIEIVKFDYAYPEDVLNPCKRYEDGSIIQFDQENSHHTLTLEDHMVKAYRIFWGVLSWGETRSRDREMAISDAIVVHDIGKYFTKTFIDSKGNKTDEAHYYGHENWGAYIALVFMNNGRANGAWIGTNHTLRVSTLINWHMRPHTAWKQSEKAKERDKMLIGQEMYDDIMLLHKADLAAH